MGAAEQQPQPQAAYSPVHAAAAPVSLGSEASLSGIMQRPVLGLMT
jgi:hypothetical protein